jgi:hypothetical protein
VAYQSSVAYQSAVAHQSAVFVLVEALVLAALGLVGIVVDWEALRSRVLI